MSALLDALLDAERLADCLASDNARRYAMSIEDDTDLGASTVLRRRLISAAQKCRLTADDLAAAWCGTGRRSFAERMREGDALHFARTIETMVLWRCADEMTRIARVVVSGEAPHHEQE